MKPYFLSIFLLTTLITFSQTNTDVILFDMNTSDGQIELSNPINISNKPDYDNQPSFINNHTIAFVSMIKNQTDIVEYNINTNESRWVTNTQSSEFSPTKIPDENAVSAIRQGLDQTQKLYKYTINNGEESPIIEDLLIGYHVWANKNTIYTAILENNGLSLSKTELDTNKHTTLITNIGRSLHRIPYTNLISYVDKNDDWAIKSYNPGTNSSTKIIETLEGSEDYCWTPDGILLMGFGSDLYKFNPKSDSTWTKVQNIEHFGYKNITRINVNADNTKLVLVAEKYDANSTKIEDISWIAGNWKGEAFGGIVEENWSEPLGDSMMASFKLVVDNEVVFYELEVIREINNTLILQLKHFNNDLKGWETKEDTVDFPLVEITKNKVVFEGLFFELISENQMNVSVDIKNNDGSIETVLVEYIKQ